MIAKTREIPPQKKSRRCVNRRRNAASKLPNAHRYPLYAFFLSKLLGSSSNNPLTKLLLTGRHSFGGQTRRINRVKLDQLLHIKICLLLLRETGRLGVHREVDSVL